MQAYVRVFDAGDYLPVASWLVGFMPAGSSFEGVLENEQERGEVFFEILEKDSAIRFDETGFGHALYRFQGSTEYCVELKELRVIVTKVDTGHGTKLRHYGLMAGVCERSAEEFAATLTSILDSFYY